MKIAIAAFLAVSLASPTLGRAGSGRQSDTIEVDYEYRAICHWLERNEKAAEESTRADRRRRCAGRGASSFPTGPRG
ncbi:MAG TPA: hypothetical protein VMR25_15945 [Planctomycetaceae bacterium]|nr:hypothetical protein [Planctomycetaceae bacterium]